MNWTGGVLDRSRNANFSLTAKQRAYFAKGKGKLNNASPQDIELFGKTLIHPGINTGKRRLSNDDHVSPHRRAKGIVRQTERLDPTTIKRSHRAASRLRLPGTNNDIPIIISSQQSSDFSSKQTRHSQPVNQFSSSSQTPGGNRQTSVPRAPHSDKARLLSIRDWVGVSHTKPAKVNFTNSLDRDQIGKRRRLSGIDHQIHKRKRQRHEPPSHGAWKNGSGLDDILSQADISVRFGSAVDQQSVRDEPKPKSMSKVGRTSAVSDEMLLDEKYSDDLAATYGDSGERPYKEWTSRLHQPHHPGRSPFSFAHNTPHASTSHIRHANEHDYGTLEDLRAGATAPRSRTSEQECSAVTNMSAEDSFSEPIPTHTTAFEAETQNCHVQPSDGALRSRSVYAKVDGAAIGSKCQQNHVDAQVHSTDENGSSLHALTYEDAAAHDARRASDGEQGMRSQYIGNNPLERLARSTASKDRIKVPTKVATHIFDHYSTDTSPEGQAKNVPKVTAEDEALWRNLIFGDKSLSLDWPTATKASTAAPMPQNISCMHETQQTQLSAEAVDAVSKFSGNPPFTEDAKTAPTTLRINGTSQIAAASCASQANSDEMLDGAVPSGSSAIHNVPIPSIDNQNNTKLRLNPPSSNAAHPSSSAPTTVDPHNGNSNITSSSSLIVEASTPKMPQQVQLSSDELSWSPARLPQYAAATPAVVFKKPARYIGEQSFDGLGEPIRLGRRKGREARRSNGRHVKERGEQRKASVGVWETKDLVGIEQDDIFEDEIEDELLGS